MQNLEPYKPRSISRTLSAGLIITLVLVAGLSLGVNFILSSREAKAEIGNKDGRIYFCLSRCIESSALELF